MMGRQDFGAWLDGQLRQRRLSMAEAARRSEISRGRISQVIGGEEPGWEMIAEMAKVLNLPLEYVAYVAGRWECPEDPDIDIVLYRFRGLPREQKGAILDLLEAWSMRYGRGGD